MTLLQLHRKAITLSLAIISCITTMSASHEIYTVEYGLTHKDSPDIWFEVYQITPDLFAICEPYHPEEVISFLILGSQQALLFDTGMGIGNIKTVVESLTSLPVIVLNSHAHYDHIGGNGQFDEIYGIESSPLDSITSWIGDGDKIDLGGRLLEVIRTPGHTPDSICLHDSTNGFLFTGDTYYPGTIWLHCPETNLDAYENSVERIAALAPSLKLLLTSHNKPTAKPSLLPKLLLAFRKIFTNEASAFAEGDKIKYSVNEFSFLLPTKKRKI